MKFVKNQCDEKEDIIKWRMEVTDTCVKLFARRQDKGEYCICSIFPNGLYRHVAVSNIFADACDDDGTIKDITNER